MSAVVVTLAPPRLRLLARAWGLLSAAGALVAMAFTATVLCGLGGGLLLTLTEAATGWRLPYVACCGVVFVAVVWAAGEWARRRAE